MEKEQITELLDYLAVVAEYIDHEKFLDEAWDQDNLEERTYKWRKYFENYDTGR